MREPGDDDDMVTVGGVLDEVRHRRVLGLPPLDATVDVGPTEPWAPRAIFGGAEVLAHIERIGVAMAALVERARARGDTASVALYEQHLAWCRGRYRAARSALDSPPAPAHHGTDRVMRNQDT